MMNKDKSVFGNKMDAAFLTDRGGREENEDAVCIFEKKGGLCAVVADGLGGHGGGKLASDACVRSIGKSFEKGGLGSRPAIAEAVCAADRVVKELQTPDCQMKTTLAFLVVDRMQAFWAHVGDSRLYHFIDCRLKEQTLDHSVSQMAVLMHEITPDQLRFHEDRCRVLRALGSESREPDVAGSVSLGEGFHAFLLCTDGFWEYVYEHEMEELLASAATPEKWLLAMEEVLKERVSGAHDNYTAAAVFCVP